MAHFLAVFGAEVARAPAHLNSEECNSHHNHSLTAEEIQEQDTLCTQRLNTVHDRIKVCSRQLRTPGKGCGFAYEQGPFCSYAVKDGVHVLMAGEVSEWPGGMDAVSAQHNAFLRNEAPTEADDAHWLLDFYGTFTDPDLDQEEGAQGMDLMSQALECLAHIQGSFSFVIYDSIRHRLLAARDREGVSPMFWGSTDEGQLLFGSTLSDLGNCNPTATAFPSGCLFTSERAMMAFSPGEKGWIIAGDDLPGELTSFMAAEDASHYRGVKAIPRITSKGTVCGAVYKVSSTADMTKPMAQH